MRQKNPFWMTLQFFPCSELTIIVKLVSVCALFACKYLNFSTYVSIHTIFQKQRVIWPQMSIVLRLRSPPSSLSHALAGHESQLSLHTCLPILLEHKFPGERDYGLVKWNGKESNICWINEWTCHRSLLSQIILEASWEGQVGMQ